jgi:hypothetical protein
VNDPPPNFDRTTRFRCEAGTSDGTPDSAM